MTTVNKPLKGTRHDLFAAIKYETNTNNGRKVRGLQLDAHFVFDWIIKDAWNRFSVWAPTRGLAYFYSAEEIFNDAAGWAEYEVGERIAIGRCLAYFVRNGMLPLFYVNPTASNKLYMVIGQ